MVPSSLFSGPEAGDYRGGAALSRACSALSQAVATGTNVSRVLVAGRLRRNRRGQRGYAYAAVPV